MTELKLPHIGFDRFIAYPWLEYSLDLALNEPNEAERRRLLEGWLQSQMNSADAAHRTSLPVGRVWLVEYPATAPLRAEGLRLAGELAPGDHLALHWGMCLANFRFFSDVAAVMGRLLRLQGEFTMSVLQQRLAEVYSNQGTVPRSVERMVQSLKDWQVITQPALGYYRADAPRQLMHPELISYLVTCALQHKAQQAWPLADALRLPELFPFEITGYGAQAVRSSSLVDVHREGSNQEILVWKLY